MFELDERRLTTFFAKQMKIPKASILEVKKLGAGLRVQYFHVRTSFKSFFMRITGDGIIETEFPERFAKNAMVSKRMGEDYELWKPGGVKSEQRFPGPIGIYALSEKGQLGSFPSVLPGTRIVEIYEFEAGRTYAQILDENQGKQNIDDEDRVQLTDIATMIASVHSIKYRSRIAKIQMTHGSDRVKAIYNDNMQVMLQMVYNHYKFGHGMNLDFTTGQKLVSLMSEIVHERWDRHYRLAMGVGDFWYNNVMFDKDGKPYLVDRSHSPWRDPGDDIGWWCGEDLWHFHLSENSKYHAERSNFFIDTYSSLRKDPDVRNFACLAIGLKAFVKSNDLFIASAPVKQRRAYIDHTIAILEKRTYFI